MFFIKGDLFGAAAFGFVYRRLHGVGDFVGVQNGAAVHIAGGAAYGLNQAAAAAQKAFFVGIQNRHQ